MAEQSGSNGIVAFLVIGAIAVGWTLYNRHSTSQKIYDNCMGGADGVNQVAAASLCECASKKMIDDLGFAPFIPFVSRFATPKKPELEQLEKRAALACVSSLTSQSQSSPMPVLASR